MKAMYKNLQIEWDESTNRKAFAVSSFNTGSFLGFIYWSEEEWIFVTDLDGGEGFYYKEVQRLAGELESISDFVSALEVLQELGVNPLEVEK